MRGVPTASRRLLILVVAVATLAVPSGAASVSFTIDHHVSGTAGTNGWYRSNVHVYWTYSPLPDSTSGCDVRTITAEGVSNLLCNATWGSTTIPDAVTVSIDKTPPAVKAAPARAPDANGWYNRPLTVSFSGTDKTSGVAGCSSTTYSGPDNANAAVPGSCTDKAGNVGRGAFGFHYDATPPTLVKVRLAHGKRSVVLSWKASPDAQLAQVTRFIRGKSAQTTTVYRGAGTTYRDRHLRPGGKYRYTVTVFDAASNSASKTLATTATGALLSPLPAARVTRPPRLVWTPVKGATYYNVQLIRVGRILSTWPTHASLKLQRSWVYKGHRHSLRPGLYRWYVWPGFGKLAQANYGRLLGGSSFVLTR